MQPAKGLSLVIETLYLLFFISISCSFRAISSIVLVLLVIAGIIKNQAETKSFFGQKIKTPFFFGCLLLYIVHFIALLYSNNKQESWLDIQTKSGLVLTPLALYCTTYVIEVARKRLLLYYVCVIVAVSVYCLSHAAWYYQQTGDFSFFFYHLLVKPVNGHAIYFSVLVFIALLLLIETYEKNGLGFNKTLHIAFIIFLSVFLFLLSSKLVIGFYFLYLIVYFIRLIKIKSINRYLIIAPLILFIIGSTLILTTNNPVSNRFSDITRGDLKVISKEKFNPGMYFNGIQFRLLQWRFTAEILNENHSWLTGIGPGNAQHFLDQKYISKNMYTGDPVRGDHGFLGYNTHNQFLETLLKTGIGGLVILLFICFSLIKLAWQKRRGVLSFTIAVMLAWLFTESVLERQYGIIIITFFPLFLSVDEK